MINLCAAIYMLPCLQICRGDGDPTEEAYSSKVTFWSWFKVCGGVEIATNFENIFKYNMYEYGRTI